MSSTFTPDPDLPVYVISVAAQLSGMHAQTLRQYDRLGLVKPSRTGSGGRRYSQRDVESLRQVQQLSQEGVSLAGISRILELQNELTAMRELVGEMTARLERPPARVFAAGRDGQIVTLRPGERPRRNTEGRSVVPYRGR